MVHQVQIEGEGDPLVDRKRSKLKGKGMAVTRYYCENEDHFKRACPT